MLFEYKYTQTLTATRTVMASSQTQADRKAHDMCGDVIMGQCEVETDITLTNIDGEPVKTDNPSGLTDKEIDFYYAQLLINDTVMFKHGDRLIEVSVATEGGYMVNVYEDDVISVGSEFRTVNGFIEQDGGLCTGSARDAIEFMIS